MVKRRIFALHSETGRAILATRRETNAYFQIVLNDPGHRTMSSLN
jgi:hypothetical protein